MVKKYFITLLAITAFLGCRRVDEDLFNPERLDTYRLDDYTGEVDFRLDDSYDIDPNDVYKFLLYSKLPEESFETYIHALYINGANKDISLDTVILYLHGNRGHMDFYWPRAKLLANVGKKNRYGILMLDYRGYGLSQGTSNEKTLYADVEAALRWLKVAGMRSDRLIVYGFSLGSAPAVEICSKSRVLRPNKLILEAPFASSYMMVEGSAKLNMPASFYTNHQIDNARKIKKVIQPFLWIHGKNDDFIDWKQHGQLVYDNHKGTYKEQQLIENANHSTIQTTWGFENYNKAILEFITRK